MPAARKILLVAGGFIAVFLIGLVVWPGCVLHSHVPPNEASAIFAFVSIHNAQIEYSAKHPGMGFAPELSSLVLDRETESHLEVGRKSGYKFSYTPGERVHGAIGSYTITAVPNQLGRTGQMQFFSDESGDVHFNPSGPADASSPILR